MATIVSTERWTYERMRRELPPESRYELRHFNLIDMSPAPKPQHQRISKRLFRLLDYFVISNRLGEVLFAPIDVHFAQGEVCQPDLVFIAQDQAQIVGESAIEGAPALIVEVVSKGSVARDYIEKKEDYERFGVQEYWIVDPCNEVVLVYVLENEKYRLFSSAEEQDIVRSSVLAGFETNLKEIFAEE